MAAPSALDTASRAALTLERDVRCEFVGYRQPTCAVLPPPTLLGPLSTPCPSHPDGGPIQEVIANSWMALTTSWSRSVKMAPTLNSLGPAYDE